MRRTETPKSIWIKFCAVVDIPDIVMYTNFGDHRLRGVWVAGGQISPSSIDFHRCPYNTLTLPCERVIIVCNCAMVAFALDHTHYSRWLPVHIRYMVTPRARIPDVAEQFSQGKFVVRKTSRPFSAISVDHTHEQNNATVKGTAGVTDLMRNPKAMLRWMVAGPEIARAITEFDTNCMMSSKRGSQQERHHEHTLSTQTSFATDMNTLVKTIDSYRNSFDSRL